LSFEGTGLENPTVVISTVTIEESCWRIPFVWDVLLRHWVIGAPHNGRQHGYLILQSSLCPWDQHVFSRQKNGNLEQLANAQQPASMLNIDKYSNFKNHQKLRKRGPTGSEYCRAMFLNCRAAALYRALASIIPGRERFSWNLSF
jgi:hypothetical protein